MQARWLLRPILGIWNKYVKGAQVERDILAIPPPLTDAVDIAAPTHLVQVCVRTINSVVSCPFPWRFHFIYNIYHHNQLNPISCMSTFLPLTSKLQVRALDAEPTFSHELHEAAYEGGQQWIERLVEEDGVAPDTKDQVFASDHDL